MKSAAAEIYRLPFQNGPIILTNCLAAGVLAVSLMFAPVARAEESQVKCKIGTLAPFNAPHRNCTMLTIQADAVREVLKNAPSDYPLSNIVESCIGGLRSNLPGYDHPTYVKTCEDLVGAVLH